MCSTHKINKGLDIKERCAALIIPQVAPKPHSDLLQTNLFQESEDCEMFRLIKGQTLWNRNAELWRNVQTECESMRF